MKSAALDASAPAPTPRPPSRLGDHFGLRSVGVLYALALIWAIISIATLLTGRPFFLQPVNIINVTYQSSLISIMGVAMTVVLITGNFDLSVASVAALSAAVLIIATGALGVTAGLVVTLGVAGLIGLLNGAIVQLYGINAFIVTLGTLTAIRGLVLIITGGRSLSVDNPDVVLWMNRFEGGALAGRPALIGAAVVCLVAAAVMKLRNAASISIAGAICGAAILLVSALAGGPRLQIPAPVVYLAIFAGATWAVLTFTVVGRRIYAVGGNAEAARLSGIRVNTYKIAAFVYCSMTAGFAGILFASRLGAINPTALQGGELTVIAAAILGGTSLLGGSGSVIKTIVGALVLFSLNSGFNILNLGANYQGVIEGTVVVAAAAIYTVGGRNGARK
jgi:D-xylose transport system permease protein